MLSPHSHPTIKLTCVDYKDSTSNLNRHVEICDPVHKPKAQTIEAFAKGVTYSWGKIRYLLAMWVVCSHHPFSIVENKYLHEILQMLYPRVHLPSRFTLSRDVQTVKNVIKMFEVRILALPQLPLRLMTLLALQKLPGKVHICVDGWTFPNVFSFLSITAHWHVNGKIEHIILEYLRYARFHPHVMTICLHIH